MLKEELFKLTAILANRRASQAQELLGFCENDIDRYIRLEAILKNHCVCTCPGNKETVDLLLDAHSSHLIDDFNKNFEHFSNSFYYKKLENKLLTILKKIENEIEKLITQKEETYIFNNQPTPVYSKKDYDTKMLMLMHQRNILYTCLT